MNLIYKYIARAIIEKQNHKYLNDKTRSFMLNMIIFKLINTNVTVVYAVNQIVTYGVTDKEGNPIEGETPLNYINGLILSLVITKAANPIFSRYATHIDENSGSTPEISLNFSITLLCFSSRIPFLRENQTNKSN